MSSELVHVEGHIYVPAVVFGVTIKVTFNWPAQQVGARCAYLSAYNTTLKKAAVFHLYAVFFFVVVCLFAIRNGRG